MMELYDVIDAASTNLKEGTLVLHRSMKVHPKFKAYKRFCYKLYWVNNKGKELIYSHEEVKNACAVDILETWSECDKSYLKWFIGWVASDEYKSMLKDGI